MSSEPLRQITSSFSNEPFWREVSRLRAARGLSCRQLACKTQLSAGYLNQLTKEARPVPDDQLLQRIAAALEVAPAHFFEYRRRRVADVLAASLELVSALYSTLCEPLPMDGELARLLSHLKEKAANRESGEFEEWRLARAA